MDYQGKTELGKGKKMSELGKFMSKATARGPFGGGGGLYIYN